MRRMNNCLLATGFFGFLICLFALTPATLGMTQEAKKASPTPDPRKEKMRQIGLTCACIPKDLKLASNESQKLPIANLIRLQGATGEVALKRTEQTTSIELDVSGVTRELFVYAVSGRQVTLLGKLSPSNGKGKGSFQTPLQEFGLVVTQKSDLK